MLNSNSTPLRPEKERERPKGKKSSGSFSKYNYSNYKYLSSGKSNKSQDRLHYSDRKFNWMKNDRIQEFTIDASGEGL